MTVEGLAKSIQDFYLTLVLLPKGYSFGRKLLLDLWQVDEDVLSAILQVLLMRCLITIEYHETNQQSSEASNSEFRLHDCHSDYLIMENLQQKEDQNQSLIGNKSFLQHHLEVMISLLTNPKLRKYEAINTLYNISFDYSCWKRLLALSQLDLFGAPTPRINPAECLQDMINNQMAAGCVEDLPKFIGYTCQILEKLNISHPAMFVWYRTALDFLERDGRAESIDAATLLNNLGLLYVREGKYEEAVDVHLKAVVILEAIYQGKTY